MSMNISVPVHVRNIAPHFHFANFALKVLGAHVFGAKPRPPLRGRGRPSLLELPHYHEHYVPALSSLIFPVSYGAVHERAPRAEP